MQTGIKQVNSHICYGFDPLDTCRLAENILDQRNMHFKQEHENNFFLPVVFMLFFRTGESYIQKESYK